MTIAIAGVLRRSWWALAAPIFAAFALLATFLSVYLIPDTHPLRAEPTAADVRVLARKEGIPGTKAEVQDVNRETTAPDRDGRRLAGARRALTGRSVTATA